MGGAYDRGDRSTGSRDLLQWAVSLQLRRRLFMQRCGLSLLVLQQLVIPMRLFMMCVAAEVDSQCHSAAETDYVSSSSSSSSVSERRDLVARSGFLSTPNYPHVYAVSADCRWTLVAQPSQTLRLTLYDFELTVKTRSVCRDYLRITARTSAASTRSQVTAGSGVTAGSQQVTARPRQVRAGSGVTAGAGVTVFEECGSRGLEVFDIAASRVQLQFHTDQSSQAHRGFLIHYTGRVD